MTDAVLDASAVIALVQHEPGWEVVAAIASTGGATIGSVNLSEVVARLADLGGSELEIRERIDTVVLDSVPFDSELAYETGLLRPQTRYAGLSLGDRACLALARRLGLPAVTTDRAWAGLSLQVEIQVIR